VIYVYCLAADLEWTLPSRRGLGGGAMRSVMVGRIGALVSEVGGSVVTDPRNATIHGEVVHAALESSSAVLPCRFGALFANEREIRALLQKEYSRLEAALARVRGKVEVGIRVLIDGPPPTSRVEEDFREGLTAGETYLIAKRRQRERISELSESAKRVRVEVDEATAPFWDDVRTVERRTREGLMLTLSYLVDREKVSLLERAYGKLRGQRPGLKLLYSGPWAPYSFAELDFSTPFAGTAGMGEEGWCDG